MAVRFAHLVLKGVNKDYETCAHEWVLRAVVTWMQLNWTALRKNVPDSPAVDGHHTSSTMTVSDYCLWVKRGFCSLIWSR